MPERSQTESTRSVGGPRYTAMRECLRVQDASAPRSRIAALFGRSPLHPDARLPFKRALEERDFLHVLTELGPNWRLLNGAGHTTSGIQTLAIGPPGVLVVAVADIPSSRATAAGDRRLMGGGGVLPAIRLSTGAASAVAQRLSQHLAHGLSHASIPPRTVKPLVVMRGAGTPRLRGAATATIVRGADLRRWCVEQERTISDAIVASITEVALQTGDWDLVPAAEGDIVRCVQRFDRLQNEITRARTRRRHAAAVGAALAVALVVALAISLA